MKKVFKWILAVAVAALVMWTFVFLWKKSRPVEVTYEIVVAEKANIEKKAVATGKVEARNEIQIKPQIAGIIDILYKEAGQMVKKDEVIARLKVIPDMVSLNAAESRRNLSKINLQQAETDFDRQKELYEKQVISKEEYEKSTVQLKSAREEFETAQNNYDLTKDGITQKSGTQSNTLIRSTIDGMILDIPVKVGNSVIQSNSFNDGTTIATIANLNDMIFVGKVDETEVGRLHEGMPLQLSIGALNEQQFRARLEYISPKGVEESGAVLFEIKAAAEIPDSAFIRAGYSANAEIILNNVTDVVSLPEHVLQFSHDTTYVEVVVSETPQQFERRDIKTGLSDGIRIEILSGIKLGEKVKGSVVSGTKPKVN